jgi:hypothetical protein
VRLEGAVKIARAMQAAPTGREPEMREPVRAAAPAKSPVKAAVPPAKAAERAAIAAAQPARGTAEPTPMRSPAAASARVAAEALADDGFVEDPAVVPFKSQAPRPARAAMERELFDALETLRQGRS